MRWHEAHVERLLGRRVRDVDGRSIGRLEEFIVEIVDGEHVVTEFHIGGAALVERIAGFVTRLPFVNRIPCTRRGFRAPWDVVDLGDPHRPAVRVRGDDLDRIELRPRQ